MGFFDIASPFNPSLDLATFDGTNTLGGGALDATYAPLLQEETIIHDPPGVWTAVGTVVSTPDAESSFDLLASALGALWVGRLVCRVRKNK